MELLSEAQIEWTLDLDDKSKFKVVVIYEDGPAGRRAKHFYDKLIYELEEECAFSLQLWSIAELMGVSGVALSMWIAGTARPTAIKLLEIKRFVERAAPPESSDFVQRL
jgi:hypothetical protein